jgi:hypothetical protein
MPNTPQHNPHDLSTPVPEGYEVKNASTSTPSEKKKKSKTHIDFEDLPKSPLELAIKGKVNKKSKRVTPFNRNRQ